MSGSLNRTRTFDFENMIWNEGPTFPVDFDRASSVPLSATFYVVTSVDDADTNVVMFDADVNDWKVVLSKTVSQNPTTFQRMPDSFLVPGSYFECDGGQTQ